MKQLYIVRITDENSLKLTFSLVLLITLLTSCALSIVRPNTPCITGKIDSNGLPCWLNVNPSEGVVLGMSEHIDPSKTREILFTKALIELAAGISGVEISENSIVKKNTIVTGNDNVTARAQVISLATVKTASGSVTVKAKVQDEWKSPTSQKLYLWVVNTQP